MFDTISRVIKKNKHKETGINWALNGANHRIDFTIGGLTKDAYYTKDEVEKTGVNKFGGFTTTLFPRIKKYSDKYSHVDFKLWGYVYIKSMHWNSFRFGWQSNFIKKNSFDIYYYTYNKGIRKYRIIDTIGINETLDIPVYRTGNSISFEIKRQLIELFYDSSVVKIGYKLFGYFGGISKAVKTFSFIFKKD